VTVQARIVAGPLRIERPFGLTGGGCGAAVEFQGVVRDSEDGAPIAGIDYECHARMAEAQLCRIAQQLASFFDLEELIVLHRVGPVPVGETSLYVRAIATRRHDAFVAVMELIEQLKRDVPIWKHPMPARQGDT